MTYASGCLHLFWQSPHRARSMTRASSVLFDSGTVALRLPAFSNAVSITFMPLRQDLPPRPKSAVTLMSRMKNISRASKWCTAKTPFSRPYDKPTAQNEAVARQKRSFYRPCDAESRPSETCSQGYGRKSHRNPPLGVVQQILFPPASAC